MNDTPETQPPSIEPFTRDDLPAFKASLVEPTADTLRLIATCESLLDELNKAENEIDVGDDELAETTDRLHATQAKLHAAQDTIASLDFAERCERFHGIAGTAALLERARQEITKLEGRVKAAEYFARNIEPYVAPELNTDTPPALDLGDLGAGDSREFSPGAGNAEHG